MTDPAPQETSKGRTTPAAWRRGAGVAPGTWDYVHRKSIAVGYDDFVADTPLCDVDQRWLQQTLPPPSKSEPTWVADFGCGTGRTAIPLAKRGYHVLAVDLSDSMLQVLGGKSGDDRIFPIKSNLVTLDAIADNSVDHAVCMFATLGMIQGRQHRRDFLSHARRIIRPGGKLCLHVHHRWAALGERGGIASLWKSFQRPDQELGDCVYSYRGVGEMFMHRYGRRELAADLRASGFNRPSITDFSSHKTSSRWPSWPVEGLLVSASAEI